MEDFSEINDLIQSTFQREAQLREHIEKSVSEIVTQCIKNTIELNCYQFFMCFPISPDRAFQYGDFTSIDALDEDWSSNLRENLEFGVPSNVSFTINELHEVVNMVIENLDLYCEIQFRQASHNLLRIPLTYPEFFDKEANRIPIYFVSDTLTIVHKGVRIVDSEHPRDYTVRSLEDESQTIVVKNYENVGSQLKMVYSIRFKDISQE